MQSYLQLTSERRQTATANERQVDFTGMPECEGLCTCVVWGNDM